MPKGPNGQKRPADSIGCAVMVAEIATGEQEDTAYAQPNKRKSGLAGAKARNEKLDAEKRSEIATEAAKARWKGENEMANTNVEMAKNRLYGEDGLKVSDFKMFPGSDNDVTPERMAQEINKVIAQLEAGDFDVVDDNDS